MMPSITRRRTLSTYRFTPTSVKYNHQALPNPRTFRHSPPNHTPSRTHVRRADTLLGRAVFVVTANLLQSHCNHKPSAWSTTSNLPLTTWLTGSSKPGVLLDTNALAS